MSQPEVASDPDKFQRLAKEASSIQTQVDQFKLYQEKEEALVDTRALLRDSEGDAEMTELAQMEITEIEGDLEVRALTALHALHACRSTPAPSRLAHPACQSVGSHRILCQPPPQR